MVKFAEQYYERRYKVQYTLYDKVVKSSIFLFGSFGLMAETREKICIITVITTIKRF